MRVISAKNSTWDNIPGFNREKDQYVQLDLKQWLKDHRIEDQGESRGKENQPAAEDDGLDAVESQIVDWVNRRGRICRANVSGHLSDLERDLANMEDDDELRILENEVDEQKREAEIAIERGNDAGRSRLSDEKKLVREGSAEFERFRQRAGLTRIADYSHRRTALRYIVVCFVIEIILNASLLMEVNPFGLLGSTMQMALISCVNVVFLGLVVGELLRQRNHVAAWRKVVAWFGIVVAVMPVLAFNLAVGHFRNSMQASVNDPSADFLTLGNDALQRLVDGPLDLASFQTALLVLLGIACFGIGAWKWYQRDDAYPGYGQLERQLSGLKEDYKQAYQREQDGLEEIQKAHISKLEDIRHKLVVTQGKWREICIRGERLVQDYPTNLSQYQHDLDFLLEAYRTANKGARSLPLPPHFNDTVRVDDEILEPPLFTPPDKTSLAGVADKVNHAILALQEEYRVARRKYETLEEVTTQGTEQARELAA